MIDYNALLDFCQTDGEIAVLVKASSDGRKSLNDMGDRILRRIIARSPDMRKKLTAYNRVYQARYRRVKKGVWPANAPTASQAVELGILDKADQYITRKYIKAVQTHLNLDDTALRPTNDNLIVLDARQQQVVIPDIQPLVSQTRKSALNVVVVGNEDTQDNKVFDQKRFAEFMVERADTIKQDVGNKIQGNKVTDLDRLVIASKLSGAEDLIIAYTQAIGCIVEANNILLHALKRLTP